MTSTTTIGTSGAVFGATQAEAEAAATAQALESANNQLDTWAREKKCPDGKHFAFGKYSTTTSVTALAVPGGYEATAVCVAAASGDCEYFKRP